MDMTVFSSLMPLANFTEGHWIRSSIHQMNVRLEKEPDMKMI